MVRLTNRRLTDIYPSYYGGFICVCWSPDGKYVLTGGQDDLVSIWTLAERQIIARCPGHHSWVTAVAFDPWRCDDRNYRFGSVGEDCRLLLWDFNVGMLHRPKAVSQPSRSQTLHPVHAKKTLNWIIPFVGLSSPTRQRLFLPAHGTAPNRESKPVQQPLTVQLEPDRSECRRRRWHPPSRRISCPHRRTASRYGTSNLESSHLRIRCPLANQIYHLQIVESRRP